MRYHLLLIGLGGAIGSILRYLLQVLISKHWHVVFPAGTFLVNIIGAFVIGILYGLVTRHIIISPEWRLFLIVGCCGGFTTFSSFSYESIILLKNSNYIYFTLYVGLSVVVGLLATLSGMSITSR